MPEHRYFTASPYIRKILERASMPKHFTSRTDMIEWLIANCPRPSIVRALQANKVEFLGGFKPIPPSNLPGWIFRVTTIKAHKTYFVCILCNDLKHKYEIRIIKHVPWDTWDGVFHGLLISNDWASGDNPLLYKNLWELKNAEKSNR